MIEPVLIQQDSANAEVPFVLPYAIGGGGSITEDLINHSKSKQNIFHAQEKIQSQIVKKEMSAFEAVKERPNNLEKLCHVLRASKATSAEPDCFFQQQDCLWKNSETV